MQLLRKFEGTLPTKEDREYKHELSDFRPSILKEFETEVRGITHSALVEEARDDLTKQLDDLWSHASERNCMFGREVKFSEILSEERYDGTTEYDAPVERKFLIWRWQESQQRTAHVIRTYERIRRHLNNGEIRDGEWQPKGYVRREDIPKERARWMHCVDRRTRATMQQPDHASRPCGSGNSRRSVSSSSTVDNGLGNTLDSNQPHHDLRPRGPGMIRSRHNSSQSVSSSSTVDNGLGSTLDRRLGSSLLRHSVTEAD